MIIYIHIYLYAWFKVFCIYKYTCRYINFCICIHLKQVYIHIHTCLQTCRPSILEMFAHGARLHSMHVEHKSLPRRWGTRDQQRPLCNVCCHWNYRRRALHWQRCHWAVWAVDNCILLFYFSGVGLELGTDELAVTDKGTNGIEWHMLFWNLLMQNGIRSSFHALSLWYFDLCRWEGCSSSF